MKTNKNHYPYNVVTASVKNVWSKLSRRCHLNALFVCPKFQSGIFQMHQPILQSWNFLMNSCYRRLSKKQSISQMKFISKLKPQFKTRIISSKNSAHNKIMQKLLPLISAICLFHLLIELRTKAHRIMLPYYISFNKKLTLFKDK